MKRREILIILISTFILVIAWIGFNVYHNSVTSTISEKLEMRISPIHPDFNSKDIQALKGRKKVVPIFETQAISTPSPTLSPEPENEPSISPSPSPSPLTTVTPTPTPGGGTPTP